MSKIEQLINQIKSTTHCDVLEHVHLPEIDEKHILPEDLKEFYRLCGGASLFTNKDYPFYIVPPEEFVLENPVIVGELCEEDISSDWYIVCNDGKDEYLTIDLNKERLGRCYDSFFDRHGLVGESQIVGFSFTELLERLLEKRGEYLYWLESDFTPLGDAYDDQ
ncbi:SMI1/KNR4 family protein [Shouchella patagoniensis]|uniref:SMI1/KNR4 family protein n=1 Tax=Shouchella patagoniensis TaxID=228576 RepID=UPI0009958206|nr:SMI1/KNR4 family protein [Shouchella patagoniensis]